MYTIIFKLAIFLFYNKYEFEMDGNVCCNRDDERTFSLPLCILSIDIK